MGNCLVTKLKGTVDNNNLPKLNEIKGKVYCTAEGYAELTLISLRCTEDVVITLTGDIYFADENGNNIGQTMTWTAGRTANQNIFIPTKTTSGKDWPGTMSLTNPYSITNIWVPNIDINPATLAYKNIAFESGGPTGPEYNTFAFGASGIMTNFCINKLNDPVLFSVPQENFTQYLASTSAPKLNSITKIHINNNWEYTININAFANGFTNINRIEAVYSRLNGELLDFVRTRRSNGQVINEGISIYVQKDYFYNVKFNNVYQADLETGYYVLSWTETTVTWAGTTIEA